MTTPPQQPKRFGWAFLLLVCLFWVGLAIGTAIGSQFVPAGSGLGGPAIALGYGVVGAFLSLIIGGIIAWKASVPTVRVAALVAALLLAMAAGFAFWRAAEQRAESRAASGLDQPLPPPGEFQLHATLSVEDTMRAYRELHIDATDWTFDYVAVGPNSDACSGTLKAQEVTALTQSIDGMRARLLQDSLVCGGLTEPIAFTVSTTDAADNWSTQGGVGCLQHEPELMALYTALRVIPFGAVTEARVHCE